MASSQMLSRFFDFDDYFGTSSQQRPEGEDVELERASRMIEEARAMLVEVLREHRSTAAAFQPPPPPPTTRAGRQSERWSRRNRRRGEGDDDLPVSRRRQGDEGRVRKPRRNRLWRLVPKLFRGKQPKVDLAAAASSPGAGESLACVVCLSSARDVVFLDCWHVVTCAACAAKVDSCPICRRDIVEYHKIYM